MPPSPTKAKKKKSKDVRGDYTADTVLLRNFTYSLCVLPWPKNRYVYITERTRYLQHDIPPIDTVVEEDKLQKKLVLARETGNWKLEAQSLMQLGQLMKWRGQAEQGDAYQIQASSILRVHTFAEEDEQSD